MTARAESAWQASRERGSVTLLRFMVWVTLRVGRAAGRALLPPIAAYFVAFSPRARRASRGFLSRALGRRATLADVYRHVLTFATSILDRAYFLSGRYDYFDVHLSGQEVLAEIMARGRGCVLLGSHLGSFEALRAAAVFGAHWDIAMLMDNANAQKVTRVLGSINPALAQTIIEVGAPDSLIRAKAKLDAGAVLGVLGDRLRPGDKPVPAPFFGSTMLFPEGPFALAAVLRAPVVLCYGLYRGGRRYDLHFELLRDPLELPPTGRGDAIASLVREYAARLEHHARAAPYNWFNFFDVWSPPAASSRS